MDMGKNSIDEHKPLLQDEQKCRSGRNGLGICKAHKMEVPTIECVFVAKFHNNRGNTLEWYQKRDGLIMDGVEDKALVSGFHRIDNDYVYFKHGDYYGLACFHKLVTHDESERNARMRSVGILGPCYKSLNLHLPFLAEQAKRLNNGTKPAQVYSDLRHLYRKWNRIDEARILAYNHGHEFPLPQNDSIREFVSLFGKNIMILWKALLLRKRILFCCPVPLGKMCHQVVSICSIAAGSSPLCRKCGSTIEPMFYVTLNDMPKLEAMKSYIAITTNQIFKDKTTLFDVFFDGNTAHFGDNVQIIKSLQFTKGDRLRYEALSELLAGASYDSPLLSHFRRHNDQLIHGTQQIVEEGSRVFMSDLPDFGLDESDEDFFLDFCDTHQLDIEFSGDDTFLCMPLTMCGGASEQLFNVRTSTARSQFK